MRIKQQDACQTDTMPFHQHWEARTEYDLEDVLNEPKFFGLFKNAMHVGGKITLIQYDKVHNNGNDSEGIRGLIILRIADIDIKTGEFQFIIENDFVEVEKPFEEVAPDGEGLELKRVFPEDGFSYIAVDSNGNTVEQFQTKAEGEQYVAIQA